MLLRSAVMMVTMAILAPPLAWADPAGPGTSTAVETGALAAPATPAAESLRRLVEALPKDGTDEEKNERAAMAAVYLARAYAPLWLDANGLNAKAVAIVAEIKRADDWGLAARDFDLPGVPEASAAASDLKPDDQAAADLTLSTAISKYARFARGGRIVHPGGQLNTNFDRRPQFIDPKNALDEIVAAVDAAAYLRALHPVHPQFEKLRQKYLALRGGKGGADSATAKRILANMEEWRWMWREIGEPHIIANVPEFMLYLYKDGKVAHSERIVTGMLDKQTAIFTRTIKHIVLRPAWRVPESIKVKELWPSLRRGGGLMRQYGLQLETKDGRALDWRTIDWMKDDIRNYEVTQPPGRRSVLGHVKFSFPSQHTIYMHDTPDKWMFNSARRTHSHGCLRLRNPMKLAELLLADDKGWDRAKIDELSASGPLNNEVAITKKIPLHITYFTAWVTDDGALKTFPDVYGHEKRITLALDGKWDKIDKGRDHLAAPEPNFSSGPARVANSRVKKDKSAGDLIGEALGLTF